MFSFIAAGQPPLPLAVEAGMTQEINTGHTRLEELQSFSSGSKDGKQPVLAQSKIDRKNSASRSLFEYADQTKDDTAAPQHSLDILPNETTTYLKKCCLK